VSVRFYLDVHVHRAITDGLRLRGVDVLTAQEDGYRTADDSTLLDRATELERVLFSQDEDLLREARVRQAAGIPFAGVVYAHQLGITIGRCIQDLELIAMIADPADLAARVEYLPL
jgi:predicted nuclease of predicted toxin-antitoxin system